MKRSSCPRSLEQKLNREVHFYCPICGGIPLIRAHTTKKYAEVGWDYNYLLAICIGCENKVEKGEIKRDLLQKIKNSLKISFSKIDRLKPYQIPPIRKNDVYLGSNFISSTDTIFSYRGIPMMWLTKTKEILTINARFYDIKGTVITAIDQNMWTADRNRFYDVVTNRENDSTKIKIFGKEDDTEINMSFSDHGIIIGNSKFYVPNNKIEVFESGDLLIKGMKFRACSFPNNGVAFNLQ